jgi:hypothetical protein
MKCNSANKLMKALADKFIFRSNGFSGIKLLFGHF